MYYPEDVIDEVRNRNDIVDVVSSYVKLTRRGSSYFGLCPFHNEKTGSFSVSPSKQIYYCFGCGAGGNVISFIMQYDNCTFPEAVQTLAGRAGITIPEQTRSPEEKMKSSRKASILEINKIAGTFYYYQLRQKGGEDGLAYFQKRALSKEIMQSFGLGYAGKRSDALCNYLRSKGISDERIAASGLVNIDERRGMYDKFWNRVIFPIMDVNNRIIGFGGRVMGDGKPKYLNSPETEAFDKSRNLYALNIARRTREPYLILCEGYMDVIAMHQAGFTNAVASLGTSLTSGHTALLRRYTQQVVLCYDSDEAGTRAAMRAIPMLRDAGISTKVLNMAPHKDPDEFIKAEGAQAFAERIAEAETSFSFILRITQKKYQMDDPEQKTRFLKEIARMIAAFDLEVERDNYIQTVSERYNVSFEGYRKMVNAQRLMLAGAGDRRTNADEIYPAGGRSGERGGDYRGSYRDDYRDREPDYPRELGPDTYPDASGGGRGGVPSDAGPGNYPPGSGEGGYPSDARQGAYPAAGGRNGNDRRRNRREAGIIRSEGMLLTWLAEYPALYPIISKYVHPDDYAAGVYREAAKTLYKQIENGKPDPAAIIDIFEDEEDQKRVAALFNSSVRAASPADEARAIRETIQKVVQAAISRKEESGEPQSSDLTSLQAVLERKRIMEDLGRLVIPVELLKEE